jgi:hypothetical protein
LQAAQFLALQGSLQYQLGREVTGEGEVPPAPGVRLVGYLQQPNRSPTSFTHLPSSTVPAGHAFPSFTISVQSAAQFLVSDGDGVGVGCIQQVNERPVSLVHFPSSTVPAGHAFPRFTNLVHSAAQFLAGTEAFERVLVCSFKTIDPSRRERTATMAKTPINKIFLEKQILSFSFFILCLK